MTIKLTAKDSGGTIEEEITSACHTVTPEIFCRSSNLLVVDCKNTGWNPLEYVKVNGEFGLLVGKRNATHGDHWNWWYSRDPSRNGEFAFWFSGSATDTNKVFLYWDDLNNLPEVEYGQKSDAAVFADGLEKATINIKATSSGIGLHMYKCRGNRITAEVSHSGRGIYAHSSPYNRYKSILTADLGHVGVHLTHNSSYNVIENYIFDDVGICESRAALYFSANACKNKVGTVSGSRSRFGRFWPIDGAAIFFETGVFGNVIERAHLSDCFVAVSDGSGMPGNRVKYLLATDCANVVDASDLHSNGMAGDMDELIQRGRLVRSGPFGLRVDELTHLETVGDCGTRKTRYEYPQYPDLPDYADWDFTKDAVNPQGEFRQRFKPIESVG